MSKHIPDLHTFATIDTTFAVGFNDPHEEDRYQAFKARLMRELYARCPSCVSYVGEQRTEGALLVDRAALDQREG